MKLCNLLHYFMYEYLLLPMIYLYVIIKTIRELFKYAILTIKYFKYIYCII